MAASNSRSEAKPSVSGAFQFPRSARLHAARDFDACRFAQYRAAARWLALSACIGSGQTGTVVRFGLVVSKRMASKSVQRNLVKRVLREAARHALPRLRAAAAGRSTDIVLRLKSAFPQADAMTLTTFRRVLRSEADELLRRLDDHLATAGAR